MARRRMNTDQEIAEARRIKYSESNKALETSKDEAVTKESEQIPEEDAPRKVNTVRSASRYQAEAKAAEGSPVASENSM